MVTPFLGYMFALGSALCNGSFASLSKCSTEDLSPVYFNSCLSLGVTISSWIFAVAYYDEISDVVLFDPAAAAGGEAAAEKPFTRFTECVAGDTGYILLLNEPRGEFAGA